MTLKKQKKRIQLNIQLNGEEPLLVAIKQAATEEGISTNSWILKSFRRALAKRMSQDITETSTRELLTTIRSATEQLTCLLLR